MAAGTCHSRRALRWSRGRDRGRFAQRGRTRTRSLSRSRAASGGPLCRARPRAPAFRGDAPSRRPDRRCRVKRKSAGSRVHSTALRTDWGTQGRPPRPTRQNGMILLVRAMTRPERTRTKGSMRARNVDHIARTVSRSCDVTSPCPCASVSASWQAAATLATPKMAALPLRVWRARRRSTRPSDGSWIPAGHQHDRHPQREQRGGGSASRSKIPRRSHGGAHRTAHAAERASILGREGQDAALARSSRLG